MILDGEDDFVNMLRHVLGVLGMTSEVVRHDEYRDGRPRRLRPGHRRPGPGRPARRRRPEDGHAPRRGRAAARAGAAVPRGLPRPPGAVPPARAPAGLQGHRLPGHPVAGVDRRAHRAGRLLQHLRRRGRCRGRRRPLPDGVDRRDRPGRPATSTWSAGRTTAASSSTPSRSSPSTATT